MTKLLIRHEEDGLIRLRRKQEKLGPTPRRLKGESTGR